MNPDRNWRYDPNLQVYLAPDGAYYKLAVDGTPFRADNPDGPFVSDGGVWFNPQIDEQRAPPDEVELWDIRTMQPASQLATFREEITAEAAPDSIAQPTETGAG